MPSILFLLASLSLFAQYPATGNKQRLGYQTTGDGLVFRGRSNDTTALKPSTINNAYFVLDTVNNILFNYIKTKGGWVFNNTDTVINNITVDTTSLSNRINLKLNISDTASMLTPYFKDADTTSLNLTSRFAAKLNISDTASMLTNYLRTGVAASTYLTQANAASTYLPLTGGTLTAGLTGTTGTFTSGIKAGNMTSVGSPVLYAGISGIENEVHIYQGTGYENSPTTLRLTNNNGSFYQNGLFLKSIMDRGLNEYYAHLGIMNNNFITFRPNSTIGIFQSLPSYTLDVNGTFNASGNSLIGGTLGVTGATTLSAPLTVNSSAVFNEGSTDSDFRVESDGNVNMVFVDASTDRVGIGTNAPSKTLEVSGTFNATGDITEGGNNVLTNLDTASLSSRIDLKLNKTDTASLSTRINGKVSLTGDEYINGQKTFGGLIIPSNGMQLTATGNNSNKLIGINASSFVGEVTLGTGLTLTSNVINASTTDTTSLSNRINLKYDKTGGTISGAVTLSTTTATPTALLGKDGSNVVGAVTTLAQTGLMKAGGTTTNTSSVGIITVAHNLSYTPSQVFVTLAQQSNYIAVCHAITSSNLSFTFYDSTTGIALNNVSVGFFWLAIK